MHSFPASVVVALAFSQQALSAVVGRNHTTPNHKRQEPKVTLDTFKDYYPDFAKEGNGPEPPLPGDDVALENVRGTRIFGGAGCDGGDWSMIKESWHDFNTIVATNGVKSDIDWNSQAAKEFWGPPGSIPQDRKDFIQSGSRPVFCLSD
jgi:hypothetical protein